MLCTTANVKALLGLTGTDATRDALIAQLIEGVSARLARAAGRVLNGLPALEYAAGRVQYFSADLPGTRTLWLAAWPIIGDPAEVKEASYEAWSAATALTVNSDYQVEPAIGALHRVGAWLTGPRAVRVTYAGGYTSCEAWVSAATYVAGDRVSYTDPTTLVRTVYLCKTGHTGRTGTPAADTTYWTETVEVVLPADLRRAAVMQAAYEFGRRSSLGLSSGGSQGGSWSRSVGEELLADVAAVCESYRRWTA